MIGRFDQLFRQILDLKLRQIYDYIILYFVILYQDLGKT